MSKTLGDLFPKSEETLRSQLAESVIYRRHRLLWDLSRSRKIVKELQEEDPVKSTTEETLIFDPKLPQPRESHMQQHRTAWSGEIIPSITERSGGELAVYAASPSRKDTRGTETTSRFLPPARYPDCPNISTGATKVQCPHCLKHVQIPNKGTHETPDSFWRFAGISVCRLE